MNSREQASNQLYKLKISELIEEYKKNNEAGSKLIMAAVELEILDLKKNEIESKLKEYNDYADEISKEFINRFL